MRLMLILALFFVRPAWSHEDHLLVCGHGFALLVQRVRGPLTAVVGEPRLLIGNDTYQINSELGEGQSKVYLANGPGGKTRVVKIYPGSSNSQGIAAFEYWASKYLQEKGIPTAGALTKPTALHQPAIGKEGEFAVVKEYVEGLRWYEIQSLKRESKISEQRYRQIKESLDDITARANRTFDDGAFTTWLQRQGETAASTGIPRYLLGEPDLGSSNNFIFTRDRGWVIIDP